MSGRRASDQAGQGRRATRPPGPAPTGIPDAIVHQMTALAGLTDFRRFERAFAVTNRLRMEGADNLLAAARASGVERVVAQSYAGWPYARVGGRVKREADPLDPDPPAQLRSTLAGIRHVEAAVVEAGGVALRYGGFYGPGTGMAPGGEQWEALRARKFPLVGDGGGVWSFCQIEDAASAVLAALSNAKVRRELGWAPRWPSWREGFAVLGR